jgi:hypothetical protein
MQKTFMDDRTATDATDAALRRWNEAHQRSADAFMLWHVFLNQGSLLLEALHVKGRPAHQGRGGDIRALLADQHYRAVAAAIAAEREALHDYSALVSHGSRVRLSSSQGQPPIG